MSVVQTGRKIGIAILAFFVGVAILYRMLSEAVIYFEIMWSTGTASRAELADSLGLGLLAMFIVVPGSIIGGTVLGWLAWRRESARKDADVKVA